MKHAEWIDHVRGMADKAQREGMCGIAAFLNDLHAHLTGPNSITLALPTYSDGDPKAGEVVEEGDHVWTIKQPWEIAYWIVDGFVVNGGAMLPYMMVRRSGTSLEKTMMPATGPYYSTADARDAAMAARKETHND